MFNVILFTDTAEFATKTRGYGTHRLASHLRKNGYSCIVIDFCSLLTYDLYKQILDLTVGPDTLVVGYATNWLPFRFPDEKPNTMDPGRSSRRVTDSLQFDMLDESIYNKTLTTAFGNGDANMWLEYPKKLNKDLKLVMGGYKVNMYLDATLTDYYIVGYAETMMIDLLDKLSGKNKRIFNKILDYDWKSQNPVWDFRESKTTYTDFDFITPQETLSLEVGRGCRFKCTYCSYPLIGMKNVNDYLKFEEVLREELLDNYNRWGTTTYYIMDDTFNDSVEKLQMMLNVTRSLPFKINFWCYLRLELLVTHPEMIPMLKELGLAQCYFGIETFNDKAGRAVGKGMSAKKKKEALIKCKECWGDTVSIQAGFLVGLPYETVDSISATSEYLQQENCPIDIGWIIPLGIANGSHPITNHMYLSEFDRNYEKYGYRFEGENNYLMWSKTDDTGIDSYKTADRVACKYDSPVKKKLYKGDFYRASLDHPILSDRNKTLAMTDNEYCELIKSIDQNELYYNTIMNQYFNPLIKKLKNV